MVFPPNATTSHYQRSPAIDIMISPMHRFFLAHRLGDFHPDLTEPVAKPHRADFGSDGNTLLRMPLDGTARVEHLHFSRERYSA